MRVFLNPNAGYGSAEKKWWRIADEVKNRLGGELSLEICSSRKEGSDRIREAVSRGEKEFVAAGGDGSVNLLLNTLMESAMNPSQYVLGAIGIGSSNDFHKPFRKASEIGGIPVRIWLSSPRASGPKKSYMPPSCSRT